MGGGFYNFVRQVRKISQIYIFYTMKLKNFFFAAIAAAFAFAACEPADPDTGTGNTGGNTDGDNQGGSSDVVETQTGFTGAGTYWITANDLVGKPVVGNYDYLKVEDAWKKPSGIISSSTQNAFTFAEVEGGYTIQDSNGKYLYATQYRESWNKNFNVSESLPSSGAVWTVEVAQNGECTITNTTSETFIQYSPNYTNFGHYSSAQEGGIYPKLVKVENPVPAVEFDNLVFVADGETKELSVAQTEGLVISAESDNSAFSVTVNANVVSVSAGATTEARTGELTVSMTCNGFAASYVVGLSQSAPIAADAVSATITFDNKETKRTEYNTSKQVWTENGITVTNEKGASTNNVADYERPARFYKSSKLEVAVNGNIVAIEFDCNSKGYATAMQSSIGDAAVQDDDKVRVSLATPAPSYVVESLTGGQVRMDAITVTYTE